MLFSAPHRRPRGLTIRALAVCAPVLPACTDERPRAAQTQQTARSAVVWLESLDGLSAEVGGSIELGRDPYPLPGSAAIVAGGAQGAVEPLLGPPWALPQRTRRQVAVLEGDQIEVVEETGGATVRIVRPETD